MVVSQHKIHYLTYGSNLHPIRLGERIPSARLLEVIQLNNYRLRFHKKSHDGSGKCNLLKTNFDSDIVFGAMYELDSTHKDDLDHFEGRGNGYQDHVIDIKQQGKEYSCFSYFAEGSHIVENLQPYHWYKNLVVLGAKYLNFPDSYVAQIEAIESVQDSDAVRRQDMQTLIDKIIKYG